MKGMLKRIGSAISRAATLGGAVAYGMNLGYAGEAKDIRPRKPTLPGYKSKNL